MKILKYYKLFFNNICVIILLMNSCKALNTKNNNPITAYAKDRILDAGDIIDLSIGGVGIGGQVMLGPFLPGFYLAPNGEEYGLKQGNLGVTEVGDLAILLSIYEDSRPVSGFAKDLGRKKIADGHHFPLGKQDYHPSYFTRIGFVIGAFFNIRMAINPGEI
ncbi:MAG: hypothetical protein AAF518_00015 [Spirochaetota bacterium]